MVGHMPNQQPRLARVFGARGDPRRRAVLRRLSAGSAAVSELARAFDMALPSFTQHLDVLEQSGLVRSRKVGRVRTYRLVPQPLKAAERWMAQQRALWGRRLHQLDNYLLQLQEDTKGPPRYHTIRGSISFWSAWSTSRPSSCGRRGPCPSTSRNGSRRRRGKRSIAKSTCAPAASSAR